MPEVRIGKEVFKTKKDLQARVKAMLHQAALGVELDRPEHDFLLELVKRHPEGEKKVGPGIRAFRVTTSEYGNRCFEVIRVDGTETDFSYLKCIAEPEALTEFTKALRKVVEKQLWEAKEKVFLWDEVIKCPVSGEMMTREQAAVEYLEPNTFEWLAEEFMVTEKVDKKNPPRLEGELEAKWLWFHEGRAKFRVLAASEQKRRKKTTVSHSDT